MQDRWSSCVDRYKDKLLAWSYTERLISLMSAWGGYQYCSMHPGLDLARAAGVLVDRLLLLRFITVEFSYLLSLITQKIKGHKRHQLFRIKNLLHEKCELWLLACFLRLAATSLLLSWRVLPKKTINVKKIFN